MTETLIVSVLIIAIGMALLCVNLLLRKNGQFKSFHIHDSEEMRKRVSHKLYIPNYPEGSECAESLNVAIATAVVCAEFRRRG